MRREAVNLPTAHVGLFTVGIVLSDRRSTRSVEHTDRSISTFRPARTADARGAGDGNRTRMTSLEGWDSAIELHPRSRSRYPRRSACRGRAAGRRGGGIRTPGLLPPKQVRYRCATPRCIRHTRRAHATNATTAALPTIQARGAGHVVPSGEGAGQAAWRRAATIDRARATFWRSASARSRHQSASSASPAARASDSKAV